MAVPKHRTSKAKGGSRESANEKRSMGELSLCTQCGVERMPHRVCPECGFYKDRIVKENKKQATK